MSGVEEVLAAHEVVRVALGGDVLVCRCGAERTWTEAQHRAHVADQLLPLIRQAQAEALRRAGQDAVVWAGSAPVSPTAARRWLFARADHIEAAL